MFNWFYNSRQLPEGNGNGIPDLFNVLQNAIGSWNQDTGFNTELTENKAGYTLTAQLPGFSRDDINVNLNGDTLTITACKREETIMQQDFFSGRSIKTQIFSKTFKMQNILSSSIKGNFENGILKIWLPKGNSPQSRVYLLK